MRARHGLEYIELFENIVEYLKIFQKKATFFTVPAGQLNRELATEDLAPSQYALPEIHSGCWVASSGQVGNNLGQLGGNLGATRRWWGATRWATSRASRGPRGRLKPTRLTSPRKSPGQTGRQVRHLLLPHCCQPLHVSCLP